MNPASATLLLPAVSAISTRASIASKGGTPSAAGEALHRFPPIVPAFWICAPPISRAAAFSPSNSGGRFAVMSSLQVLVAPMRQ